MNWQLKPADFGISFMAQRMKRYDTLKLQKPA